MPRGLRCAYQVVRVMKHKTKTSHEKSWAQLEPDTSQKVDPVISDPDELRDRVRNALSKLCVEERIAVRDQLLAQLHQAGVHLGNVLFALGIAAEMPSALMPSDVAYLIRYVRINSPDKIRAVAGLLTKLMAPDNQRPTPSRLAA